MLEESIKHKVDKLFLNASKKEEETRKEIQRFEKIYLGTKTDETIERKEYLRDTTILGHRFSALYKDYLDININLGENIKKILKKCPEEQKTELIQYLRTKYNEHNKNKESVDNFIKKFITFFNENILCDGENSLFIFSAKMEGGFLWRAMSLEELYEAIEKKELGSQNRLKFFGSLDATAMVVSGGVRLLVKTKNLKYAIADPSGKEVRVLQPIKSTDWVTIFLLKNDFVLQSEIEEKLRKKGIKCEVKYDPNEERKIDTKSREDTNKSFKKYLLKYHKLTSDMKELVKKYADCIDYLDERIDMGIHYREREKEHLFHEHLKKIEKMRKKEV